MSLPSLTGAVAFLVCVAALPAIRCLSWKYGLYDAQGTLKIHQGQIPRLGGLAMMLGLAAGSFAVCRSCFGPARVSGYRRRDGLVCRIDR
jgi:UDP-N-acetylmuramyl pentapeptide phosphotransferase/UDP-N-acetylglucosamine-1-phosphate transferase